MTLFKKILSAMLLISLLPLLISALLLALNLGNVREKLADKIAASADLQASVSLRQRAELAASDISSFLKECEGDLSLLTALQPAPQVIRTFYDTRKGIIWYRRAPASAPREVKEWIPRYSSLSIIDAQGQETFSI